MYLVGEIFYYSLLNAEDDLRTEFLEKVDSYIYDTFDDEDFVQKMGLNMGDSYLSMISEKEYKTLVAHDPLYKKYIPDCIKEENKYPYLVLFQSIRLTGLMHDLGHPPFSHITEYALKDVFAIIRSEEVKEYNDRDSSDEEIEENADMVLPSSICGLWDAVKKVHTVKEYFNALIQWDDAWLMTILKRSFFEKYYDQDSDIRYKLEELLSNRKHYNSLVKRMEEFKDIDKRVATRLSEKNITVELEKVKESYRENERADIISSIESMIKSYQTGDISGQGFILCQLNDLFDTLIDEDNIFDVIVKEAVEDVVNNYEEIRDALVVAKPLKTGLKKMPYIYRNDEVHLLDEFSNIKKDLERDRNFFPLFYIYLHNPNYIEYSKLRVEVGKSLADKIVHYINEIS